MSGAGSEPPERGGSLQATVAMSDKQASVWGDLILMGLSGTGLRENLQD
jgi:hypothetical protein